jgi:hypothetical protein
VQTTPQAPQFLGAIAVFTQRPPHRVFGALQLTLALLAPPHTPFAHF